MQYFSSKEYALGVFPWKTNRPTFPSPYFFSVSPLIKLDLFATCVDQRSPTATAWISDEAGQKYDCSPKSRSKDESIGIHNYKKKTNDVKPIASKTSHKLRDKNVVGLVSLKSLQGTYLQGKVDKSPFFFFSCSLLSPSFFLARCSVAL